MSDTIYQKRADWKSRVTADMTVLYKKILKRASEKGQLSKEDSQFLVHYDRLTRVCNICGKPVGTRLWSNRLFRTKSGETLPIGLSAMCFDCEMKEKLKAMTQ